MPTNPIFISYSNADMDIVWPFAQHLSDRLHAKCWIDKDRIKCGEDMSSAIYKGLDDAKVVLLMLSDNSIASKWTRMEVDYAREHDKRVIPVVIDGKGLRSWALEELGKIDYVDINKKDRVEKLIRNIKEWYPNIGNKYYLTLAREHLSQHPRNLSYAVRYEVDADLFYVDVEIVPLTVDEVREIRKCVACEDKKTSLEERLSVRCPEIYAKLKHHWMNLTKIEDIDKEMVFVKCKVAVFEDGLSGAPKRINVPVSMTREDYEDLLAWKLELRSRDIFSLQQDMPLLAGRIITQIKRCTYLNRTDVIDYPFTFEIVELEQDAEEILGERELEAVIYDAQEDECSEFFHMVGEWFQTILQIYERHLFFGQSCSRGNYMIEISDVRELQKTVGAASYKDIQKWIEQEFGGEYGVVNFKGWLEGQNLEYIFCDNEAPELGCFYLRD